MTKNHKLSLIAARNFLKYCIERRVYIFLGRTHSWGSPDVAPQGDQESVYNFINDFNETVFAKKILESDFSLVIRRINWEEKVFAQWNDKDPLIFEKDFYCLASNNNVYKCISNNNGSVSTVEPNVVSTVPFQTSDGYVWRYMFTVNNDDALKFLTPNWIPVKEIYTSEPGYENQYASQSSAVPGTIDRIDIIQGGVKYSQDTTINIIGDGTGATATVTIHPITGSIISVSVTNRGQNYTWAKVIINDPQAVPGTGGILEPVLSPLYGHGYNPAEELFVSNVIASCKIQGNEGNLIKGNINYRKIMLVVDPKLKNGEFATGYRYINTPSVTLQNVSGTFILNEKVTFSGGHGYVAYIDSNTLYLTSLNGTPNGIITGETSSATGTVQSVTNETFKVSGSIILRSYFDPRTKLINDNIEIKPIFSF